MTATTAPNLGPRRRWLSAAALLLLFILGRAAAAEPVSLAGTWDFRLDPEGKGIEQGWWEKALTGNDTIALPGSTDEGKKGPGNTAAPNFDYLYRLYPYVGAAWYQREIEIPEAWKGRHVALVLERCHWETRIWVDDRPVGMQDSLCVAHVHPLGALTPGKHRLTLRVDNSHKYDMGKDAHSTSDQTQTNWNGVVGKIELRASEPVWIETLRTVPPEQINEAISFKGANLDQMTGVRIVIRNTTGAPVKAKLSIEARCGDHVVKRSLGTGDFKDKTELTAALALGNAVKLWDEFSPNLYTLTARLETDQSTDEATTTFGMRKIAVDPAKKQITLNGRPFYVRGTLDCCIYPKTGYPPTDVAAWRRIIGICQSYGLNHIRFHSWCPPEAAFVAADGLGFTFQVELPCWIPNYGSPGMEARDRFLRDEMHRILEVYGHHPSFIMLCMGNEPGPRDKLDFIHGLVKEGKTLDPRRLYMAGSGWGFGPDDDYHVTTVRGLRGPGTDHDFRDQDAKHPVPVVSHEIGQWTVYPNLEETKKYDGVVRARNFDLVRDGLKARGLLDQAFAFTRASGLLMVQLYKEEIEVLLRTPGHGGFQLLDLHDFPGQGTALIGTLDPFWDSKGLIEPAAWRQFCSPIVPLLRLPKRVYTTGETFSAAAEVAQFGPTSFKGAAAWIIQDEQGAEVASGKFGEMDLPTGKLSPLGKIETSLANVKAPARLTVTVWLSKTTLPAANSWNIWVYPARVTLEPPAGVTVAKEWDDKAAQALAAGGRVLLLTRGSMTNSHPGSFVPVFWSPIWFKRGAGTMSILCDPRHPALAAFPTAMQTDWQWYELLTQSRTLILNDLPRNLKPIVQMIDNFSRNDRLGNILEARVGRGRLLVCSIDLDGNLESRPAARQLLRSLYDYVASEKFQPVAALEPATLEKLFGGVDTTATADGEAPGYEATNVLDANPQTLWHTPWEGGNVRGFPHQVVIELSKPVAIRGVRLLPRQDNNRNGWIKDYEVYVSADGKQWGAPVAKGSLRRDARPKDVSFGQAVTGRFIKLVALADFDAHPYASLAELEVMK